AATAGAHGAVTLGDVRVRSLRVLLAALVVVLFAGAVVTAEVARASSDGPRPCHTDVRCSGQSLTTATGPLAPPESWSTVLAETSPARAGAGAATTMLQDPLTAPRLVRPPRLAAGLRRDRATHARSRDRA